jgi:hypothetical protein
MHYGKKVRFRDSVSTGNEPKRDTLMLPMPT